VEGGLVVGSMKLTSLSLINRKMSPPTLTSLGPRIVRLDGYVSPDPTFSSGFPHTYTSHHNTPHDSASIIDRLSVADVAVTTRVPINAEVIEKCAGTLKLIAVFAIGYDMIDVEACKKFGVQIRNVKGASVEAVAEHVLGFYFGLRRCVVGMY
jgi:lactate dehydrogenase-like 2-hydroxyacid dehydrogenase